MKPIAQILILMAIMFVLAGSSAPAELRYDEDTGKYIEEGFDIGIFAQLPTGVGAGLAFGPGGSFGTYLYVSSYDRSSRSGLIYRVNSAGEASLFATVPTNIAGIAFPNPGSNFGDYMYLGSPDGYWSGNKTIYRMDASGNHEEFFAGSNFLGGTMNRISFPPPGSPYGEYLFTQDDALNQIYRIDSDGTATTFSSDIPLAEDFIFDTYGLFDNQLIVVNISKSEHGSYHDALFKVAPDGTRTTFLGNVIQQMGGGVITDPSTPFAGKLYLVENYWPSPPTGLYAVSPDGSYELFARNFDFHDGTDILCGPDGALYVADAPAGIIYQIVPETSLAAAIGKVRTAIVEKTKTLEAIEATLAKEIIAYDTLAELLAGDDLGDLQYRDIVTAKQKVHSAMQHQTQAKHQLEAAIEKLKAALEALGVDPSTITVEAAATTPTADSERIPGDVDGDGDVDLLDLSIMSKNYGRGTDKELNFAADATNIKAETVAANENELSAAPVESCTLPAVLLVACLALGFTFLATPRKHN